MANKAGDTRPRAPVHAQGTAEVKFFRSSGFNQSLRMTSTSCTRDLMKRYRKLLCIIGRLHTKQLMRKQDFLERVIRRFIPPPILYVCEAEESGWFAEIGRVAVIFVNIGIKGLPDMDLMQSVYLVS